MHLAICVLGAALALGLGAPPHGPDRRTEPLSRGGRPLEAARVVERGPDATREDVSVRIERAAGGPGGEGLGWFGRRDSDTDGVPADPGVLI